MINNIIYKYIVYIIIYYIYVYAYWENKSMIFKKNGANDGT